MFSANVAEASKSKDKTDNCYKNWSLVACHIVLCVRQKNDLVLGSPSSLSQVSTSLTYWRYAAAAAHVFQYNSWKCHKVHSLLSQQRNETWVWLRSSGWRWFSAVCRRPQSWQWPSVFKWKLMKTPWGPALGPASAVSAASPPKFGCGGWEETDTPWVMTSLRAFAGLRKLCFLSNSCSAPRKSWLGRNSVFLPTKPNIPHNQS